MFSKIKKYSVGTLIALGLFVNSAVLFPEPAHAQLPTLVVGDIPKMTDDVITTILEGLGVAAKSAVIKMVDYGIRKISYDSAVWLATGGKGQSPLAHTNSFGSYLKDVGDQAAGAALQELGKAGGLNLCKVPDIRLDLSIKIGLRSKFLTPGDLLGSTGSEPGGKPNCTLSQWAEEWGNADTWSSKYGGRDQLSKQFNKTFTTDDSPLGIYGAASEKINNIVRTQTGSASLQREENKGFKALETKVSGQILTPAPIIAKKAEDADPAKDQKTKQEQASAAVAGGDVKILPAVLTLFLDTLVSTAVKNFQEKGMFPFGLGCATAACEGVSALDGDIASGYYGLSGGGSVAAAQNFFDYLKKAPITIQENYDIISQLNSCTDSKGLYNCRVDDGLVQALKQAQAGQPITIADAIKDNLLHPDWLLIPAGDNSGRNTDPDCYKKSYCQSNIQVLRQLRILPLGFEIAARNSYSDRPWKLGDVIAGFDKCTAAGASDVNSPFCHLIDPNWVLKAPPTKCSALAYGPNLLAEGVPTRMQECVDVQTCVAYDSAGNCLDYGYCTREKNTWNFGLADKCSSPHYATCRAFKESATGKNVAYLYRTLDSASCTQQNVGCNAYSLSQDSSGWVAPGTNVDGTNRGIYFNNKVETGCSANSAGCSSFNFVGVVGNPHFVKKAPDYLGCYDADPTTTTTIDWPKTPSDLAKINVSPACNQYAGVCIPEEVSCNFYTPVKGTDADKIPGRFTPAEVVAGEIIWNDQCDAKCSGYAAYSEMPSNYANGQSVAYVVPSSGRTCVAQDSGCTAFTNLSTTQGGLEKSEFFTYLRACVTSAKDNGKQFVTYEGSVQGGYQLKTFTLVENKNDPVNGPTGSPKYFVKTNTELVKLNEQCNESKYKAGIASPDCRQFNDDAGAIYYRLLAYTIPVSDQCTPYRLSNNEFLTEAIGGTTCFDRGGLVTGVNSCQLCFQNGEYRDGSCFYDGLPGQVDNSAGSSITCAATANTCREYKGNNGNNIDRIFNDTFEKDMPSAVLAAWSNGTVAAESTHRGENSLLYNGQTGLTRNVRMSAGESYDLTFWAKGSGGSVTIKTGEQSLDAQREHGTVSVNDTWKLYHVGPFEYKGSTTSAKIVFTNNPSGRLFVDNVTLVRVKSMLYLVKDSLKVDAVCDSNLNDNLPGEALGCKAYTNPQKETKHLTGFSSLCRDNAVGCTAMLDMKNTASASAQAYNVWLSGDENTALRASVGSDQYTCTVTAGSKGCYVNVIGHNRNEIMKQTGLPDSNLQGHFVTSTIYTEEDTSANASEYLVANEAATCNAVDLGCTLAGAQRLTPTGVQFITTTIKNDPAKYDTALCLNEAVGCNSYSDGSDTRYFKDPAITGQKVCSYRTGVTVKTRGESTIQASGWFWKGVGVCSDNNAKFCSQNSDCGGTATCSGVGDQACYPEYLNNGEYGLWSAANDKYKNFVGECPVTQNSCTEFIDRNDNNQAYYLLKNNKVSAGNCSGQVSQRAGCAAFDQTDNPNKFFNAGKLYTESERLQGALVAAPQTNVAGNDSNIILNVTRDRSCGEWLSCPDGRSVFDENTGKFKYVCYSVSRCTDKGCGAQVARSDYAGNVLSENVYRSRGLGWKNMDYSGYSLLNVFPIEELSEWNYSTSSDRAEWHLVKKIACNDYNCLGDRTDYGCQVNGQVCGYAQSGTCKNNLCVVAIDGTKKIGDDGSGDKVAPKQSCRAYPEKDAPYPNLPNLSAELDSSGAVVQAYSAAHFCSESERATDGSAAYACDCSYDKIQYGDSITKYWNYFTPATFGGGVTQAGGTAKVPKPAGLCLGGASYYGAGNSNGKACTFDWDCGSGGTCQTMTKETRFLGFKGFCLEEDLSRIMNGDQNQHPCLTWWPNNTLQGVPDAYNQYKDAGFNPNKLNYSEGPFYCAASEPYEYVNPEIKTIYGVVDCDRNLPINDTGNDTSNVATISQNKINTMLGVAEEPMSDFMDLLIAQGGYAEDYQDNKINKFGCWSPHENYYSTFANRCDGSDAANGPNKYLYAKYSYESAADNKDVTARLCPAGYKLGNVRKVVATDPNCTAHEYESLFTITYECFPPAGYWTPVSKGVSDVLNPLNVENVSGNGNPLVTNFCSKLYKVSDSTGNNKAWTQRLAPNTTNITKPVPDYLHALDTDCFPFGATSLPLTPTGPVVQIAEPDKCFPTFTKKLIKDIQSDQLIGPDYAVFKQSDWSLEYLQDIFAGVFNQLDLGDEKENKCHNKNYYNSPANGHTCPGGSDSECRGVMNNDTCEPSAKVCTSSNGDRLQPCTSDGDCVGAKYCIDDAGEKDRDMNGDAQTCSVKDDCYQFAYGASDQDPAPHPRNCVVDPVAPTLTCKHDPRAAYTCVSSKRTCNSSSDCNSDQLAVCTKNLSKQNSWNYTSKDLTNGDISGGIVGNAAKIDPKPPTVVGVGDCRLVDDKQVCNEGAPGFSLYTNSKFYTNEPVQILVPGQRVDARFFTYADNNQMPIRKISIDWGDGKFYHASDEAYYHNRRGARDGTCVIPAGQSAGTCLVTDLFKNQSGTIGSGTANYGTCRTNNDCKNTPVCVSSEKAAFFGLQKDVTCDNTYAGFSGHVYVCEKRDKDDPANDSTNNNYRTSCPVDKERFPDGCCVFKPKVQVKDNWGWSTGNCTKTQHPNGGCYDGSGQDGKKDETDLRNNGILNPSLNPWLYYGDSPTSPVSVYVTPKVTQ